MAFSVNDIRRVGDILAAAAAAEVMPRFRKLAPGQIRQKSSVFDLVTEADEASEAAIAASLAQAFPAGVVVGEEGTHKEPALLDRIADAELAFIVDPIDGTRNFASGLPLFGVIAAVTIRGDVAASVIYDPVCHDWAYAVQGGGAWIEQPDGTRTPLHVAEPAALNETEGFVSSTYLPEPLRTTVNGNLSRFATTAVMRCAAHEYRTTAAGHAQFQMYNRLMPWDHAPGWLLHQEAGGYSAHFDGSPYRATHFTGGLITAPDEASWRTIRDALLEPRQGG